MTMRDKAFVLPLALAVLALLLSLIAFRQSTRAPSRAADRSPWTAPSELDERMGLLSRDVDALRSEVRWLADQALVAAVQHRSEVSAEAGAESGEGALAVAELEELLTRLRGVEERVEALPGPDELRAPRLFEVSFGGEGEDEGIEELQGRATDPTSSAEDKLAALRRLRFRRDELGNDARSPAVVASLVELAWTSPDGDLRADVWRQMHGVSDPALGEALLDALTNDDWPSAREEAAESLDEFLDDGRVVAALRYAMLNDDDMSVRRQAVETLIEGGLSVR